MSKLFNVIPGADTACILLYGNIGGHDKVEAAEFVSELMDLQSRYSHIEVRINSYGGEVYEGIAICNALRNSAADIDIYVDGIAASIASVIALCGKPLHMAKFARLMLHQVTGSAYGTVEEMRRAADEAEDAQKMLAQIIAGKCRMTEEQVTAKYFSGGDHWIGAQEALAMGLADSVYDVTDVDAGPETAAYDIYRLTINRLEGQPQNHNDMALFEDLRQSVSTLKDAATEKDVLQRVAALENDAAKVPALQSRVKELEDSLSRSRKAAHGAIIDQAVADGRMREEQRESMMALLDSDEENARKLIDSLPKKTARIRDYVDGKGGSANDLENMTWDQIDRANRLQELKDNYPELYEKKFKETFNK